MGAPSEAEAVGDAYSAVRIRDLWAPIIDGAWESESGGGVLMGFCFENARNGKYEVVLLAKEK